MKQTFCAISKINLFIKVTGKRPDSYHEIETVFWPLNEPGDLITIDFDAAPGIRAASSLAGLPEDLDNIAGKAAAMFAQAAKLAPHWDIWIQKVIPVAAGMGGGSSDAACVLDALNTRYSAFSAKELAALAVTVGADVPFFLNRRPVIARGVGEIFTEIGPTLKKLPLVIVNPAFPVSAKWAYRHLDARRIGPARDGHLSALLAGLADGDPAKIADNLHNDLEYALYDKFPLLNILKDFMLAHGGLNVLVSGSGSSLYAVCPDPAGAAKLTAALKANFKQILVFTP